MSTTSEIGRWRREAMEALAGEQALDLIDVDGHCPPWVEDLIAPIYDELEKLKVIANMPPSVLREAYSERAEELRTEWEKESAL